MTSSFATNENKNEAAQARIVVAMSGGVDSTAAALLLAEQGYPIVGIAMQVWDYRQNDGNASRATCCAPADFADAREVADELGFPFYVFDFEGSFREEVINPFIKSYLNGFTPNPCLDCNRKVKFRELRERARQLGCQQVATGHYAQIRALADGTHALLTAVDKSKDQSYFLYALTQSDLQSTLFPVGGMEKKDVRALLAARGLEIASKGESQDICFVSGTVGEFIEKHAALSTSSSGEIVDQAGKQLGTHEGIHNFTVGQRRGLRVSASDKLYVLNIDADSNQVTVGARDALARESFTIGDVNWIRGLPENGEHEALVKLRYRHHGVRCRLLVEPDATGELTRVRAEFLEEWSAVSPGQAAVFYSSKEYEPGVRECLGGGIIEKQAAQRAKATLKSLG